MNILLGGESSEDVRDVLRRAEKHFSEADFAVVTMRSAAEARPVSADVVIVMPTDAPLAERPSNVIELLDSEPVVIVGAAPPLEHELLVGRDDVRQWRVTPTNRDRLSMQLVAHVGAMIAHGDDFYEVEPPEDLARFIAERVERDGELVPPWVEYPELPRLAVGWEMGEGEYYRTALDEWLYRVGGEFDRRAYIRRHAPLPVSWVDWAAAVMFPFQEQRDPESAIRLLETEGLADFAAWKQWERGGS